MNSITIPRLGRLAFGVTFLAAPLFAATAAPLGDVDPHGFNDVRQMIAKMPEMTDRNKDGTVSRKEYLEMQGRLFDMASKKGSMTMAEFKAFMMEFRTFGQ